MCLRNLAAYAETRTVVLQCGIVPLLLPLLLVTHVDVTMCAARALCKLCVDRDFFDSCNVKEAVCVLLQSLQLHPDRCGMQLLFASLTSHARQSRHDRAGRVRPGQCARAAGGGSDSSRQR